MQLIRIGDYVHSYRQINEHSSETMMCGLLEQFSFVAESNNVPVEESLTITIVSQVFDEGNGAYVDTSDFNGEIQIRVGNQTTAIEIVNGVGEFDFSSESVGVFNLSIDNFPCAMEVTVHG